MVLGTTAANPRTASHFDEAQENVYKKNEIRMRHGYTFNEICNLPSQRCAMRGTDGR